MFIGMAHTQVPNWVWAKKAGRAKGDRANAVTTDGAGNAFVCGEYQNYWAQGFSNNSGYGSDIFVVKYDNNSNMVWGRSYGGTNHDVPSDICTDFSGNVFLAGYFFSSQLKLGTDSLVNSSTGFCDFFLIKIDINGNILWRLSGGSNGNDKIRSISTDAIGNLYLCGTFEGDSIVLGSDTLMNSNPGTSDIFICKVSASGNFIWNLSVGGLDADEATSLFTIAPGDIYVSGNFKSSMINLGSSIFFNSGGSDLFLAKLDANGNFIWSNSFGASGDDSSHAVTVNGQGKVFLAGGFASDSISFGGSSLHNLVSGTSDAFICSFDSSGSLIWNKTITGINNEMAEGISSDFAGSVCLSGIYTSDTISIDSISMVNTNGSPDIFLMKFDSSGNVIWKNKASGSLDDISTDVTISSLGDIYSIGYFISPELNSGPLYLTNVGNCMPFLIRYSSSGVILYGDQIIFPTSNDRSWDVATDSHGNAFITGWFRSSSIHFDTFEVRNTNTGYDLFIVKYDSAGNVSWTKSNTGKGFDFAGSLCIDPFDNIFITGFFSDTISFDSISLPGPNKIFICKMDNNGNLLWAKEYGDGSATYDICTDLDGNIYIAGWFTEPTSVFGSFTLVNSAPIYSEIFIMKLDSSGNVLWARSAQGNNNDMTSGIAVDQNKNVFITGHFSSDSISFGSTTIQNNGSQDLFITKLDSNGTFLWSSGAGDHYNDESNAICIDPAGNAYVTGYFSSSSLVFGSTTLTNPSVSKKETFIVRYNSDGSIGWAKSAGGTEYDEATDIISDINGNIYQTGLFNSPVITFGSYILTNKGCFLTRYDSTGNIFFALDLGESSSSAISINESGIFNITGDFGSAELPFGSDTLSCMGGYNIFIARLDSMLFTNTNKISEIDQINIYPNPFSSKITLVSSSTLKDASIILYNILGESISQEKKINGYTAEFYFDNLQRGIYFFRIMQGDKIISTKKLIKID